MQRLIFKKGGDFDLKFSVYSLECNYLNLRNELSEPFLGLHYRGMAWIL